jgi:hypothetical protein
MKGKGTGLGKGKGKGRGQGAKGKVKWNEFGKGRERDRERGRGRGVKVKGTGNTGKAKEKGIGKGLCLAPFAGTVVLREILRIWVCRFVARKVLDFGEPCFRGCRPQHVLSCVNGATMIKVKTLDRL